MTTEFEVTGRIVWGHPMRASPKLDNRKQPLMKKNGTPRMVRSFGLAVPLAQFQTDAWPAMHKEATSGYPNALNMGDGFRWKYKTAEHFDKQGRPYAEREGYAGNVVLSVSSELDSAPPLYRQLPTGQFQQMGADEIKCGDYVFVRIGCALQKPTDPTHTPSLYINPIVLIFAGYGAEIVSASIDPNQLFAGRMIPMAAGASAMPTAPTMAASVPAQPVQGGMPGMGAQMPVQGHPMQPPAGYAQQGMPQSPGPAAMPGNGMPGMSNGPPAMTAAFPSNPAVQPAHGFVANAGMPGMQPPPGFPVPGR